MKTNTATAVSSNIINGVDVDQITHVIDSIDQDTSFAAFQFRTRNKWVNGGLNCSQIQDFYAGGKEDDTRAEPFVLDADEPAIVAGNDTAPNPVEYVLHALAGCLTTTLIFHASVRGIQIDSCESYLEGDMDVRGLLGISDEVRKGYHHVRVTMKVKSDADVATLKELAMYSSVYDIVSQSLPVELTIEKV
jgi:uncharacterized OsmC-like protein